MSELEKYAEQLEIKKIVITMILSAFGFLLALQWRDVIRHTMDVFIPVGEGLLYEYEVALGLTITVAIATVVLLKIQRMNIIPDHLEPHKRLAMEIKKRRNK